MPAGIEPSVPTENAINKIIYAGQILIDLTADTVTADKLLNGITAHAASGKTITGTCTFDSDTQDATAQVAEVLEGKTFYARGAKMTGTMPAATTSHDIATVDEEWTIPTGFHDGSGKVKISDTEKAKLIAANIREGIEVLGVTGTMSGTEAVNAESVTVTPSRNAQTITPSEGYNYISQVTVNAIPYSAVENSAGGYTVTIAGLNET